MFRKLMAQKMRNNRVNSAGLPYVLDKLVLIY